MSKGISLEQYHQIARDISNILDGFLRTEFERREDADILFLMYRKFFDRKAGKEHQRPLMVYIAAELFGVKVEKSYANLLPIMAITELAIWSAYGLNWVTDGKNQESQSQNEVMVDLVASQYLWTEIINFDMPDRVIRSFIEFYRREMRSYLLVETDLTITNYNNMIEEEKFWRAYNMHGTHGTGYLYAYCFEVVDQYFSLNIPTKAVSQVSNIMAIFGRNMQIINDSSDLMKPNQELTTTEKQAVKDYFIDIRTNRLTYPIWLLLNKTKSANPQLHEEIIKAAQDRQYEDSFVHKVTAFIEDSRMMVEIYTLLRSERKRMVRNINRLGIDNRGSDMLKILSTILTHNKFLNQLKKDYSFN